ncbi:phosphotriesterase-related protein [Metabacillus sp. GX 13764]|uniref:phosphotriesterase family protein n=1 Tax=Metabacillus kandeliae TaxID=2900151 RepID=UPI001E524727|nr:phosphotriesterase-related protein [Metabacillus kandeliae]MCD7032703.1 phosphotriesterase-related protein [Metabacillus kandeliae]
MTRTIQTVTGPIEREEMGKTLIHEHFVFGYPGFQGDVTLGAFNGKEAFDAGVTAALQMMSCGVQTVVDPTPNECGRNPELLREISDATGLQIICGTGFYYEGEGATPYFKFRQQLGTAEDEILEMFLKELKDGIAGTGIKPAIIKTASSKGEITPYEEMFFKMAAKAQRQTGAVIMTHTQEGTMGPEQAKLLIENGADPKKIVIGHMCGNTDPYYHKRVLETGAWIAFDRFGLQGMVGAPNDSERITTLAALLEEGYADQIMLSHDTVNFWMGRPLKLPPPLEKIMENWHPSHLFEAILPALREQGVSHEVIDRMLVENPARLFFQESSVEV